MAEIVITQERAQLVVQEGEKNDVVLFLNPPSTIEISQGGPQGPPGPGFPSGGTTGDVLIKVGSGYYDSTWTKDLVLDTVSVRTTATGTVNPGQLRWNPREHTVDVGMLRGVVNQLGQETTMICLNTADVTVANGSAVMFTGTDEDSGHPTIGPMIADGSVSAKVFFGVATEEIAPDAEGYVTIFGKVRDIDTSAFPEDSILWLDPTNPGGYTLTQPMAPALKIAAAAVIHSHPTEGTLLVRADVGAALSECHDVEAEVIGDKQFLGWSEDMQHWMPLDPPNKAPRSITISEPLPDDTFTLFRTSKETTLEQVTALVAGRNGPGVSYELRYAADRTASGTLATVPGFTSVTTTGSTATVQNMPIPSGNYVWLKVNAVSGTTTEFNLSLAF